MNIVKQWDTQRGHTARIAQLKTGVRAAVGIAEDHVLFGVARAHNVEIDGTYISGSSLVGDAHPEVAINVLGGVSFPEADKLANASWWIGFELSDEAVAAYNKDRAEPINAVAYAQVICEHLANRLSQVTDWEYADDANSISNLPPV